MADSMTHSLMNIVQAIERGLQPAKLVVSTSESN